MPTQLNPHFQGCSRELLNSCPTVHAGGRANNKWGRTAMWDQIYNPLGNTALSTIAAAVPVVTLLVLIASGKV